MTPVPKVVAAKLVVGYTTKVVSEEVIQALMPEFQPAKNLGDPEKMQANVAEKRASFLADAREMPYTATLASVFLMSPIGDVLADFRSTEGDTKQPVSIRVVNWILKSFPNAWQIPLYERKVPDLVIVGFAPRTFLKIMALEYTTPAVQAMISGGTGPRPPRRLPLHLWYGNRDCRDVGDAVLPRDYKALDLVSVVRYRSPANGESLRLWNATMEAWKGPGHDAELDARVATELAAQLGLFTD